MLLVQSIEEHICNLVVVIFIVCVLVGEASSNIASAVKEAVVRFVYALYSNIILTSLEPPVDDAVAAAPLTPVPVCVPDVSLLFQSDGCWSWRGMLTLNVTNFLRMTGPMMRTMKRTNMVK